MSLSGTVSKIGRLSDEERERIEICNEASQTSEWCADECLGSEEMEECARMCRDVADITSLHARLMDRGLDYSGHLAEACEACAEECRQHDHDYCQINAEVLKRCTESCRGMSGA